MGDPASSYQTVSEELYAKYIALEETNFLWTFEEVERFERLWDEGADIWFLSKVFKRTHVEMAILIMDRHLKGHIKMRAGGILGGNYEKNS